MNPPGICLWFDGQAEEAANFYVSLLPNSRIDAVIPAAVDTPASKAGETLCVEFTLNGAPYLALNGGPYFTFTPAVSIMVPCETQAEIDRLWDALGEGGKPMECGWMSDRYGLSWQIFPRRLMDWHKDPDPGVRQRTMASMMTMVKLDLPTLEAAARG
jgi:predicted 3-demethylubiquinone-9 3-methyltransferase (glyoxalase superfamily)